MNLVSSPSILYAPAATMPLGLAPRWSQLLESAWVRRAILIAFAAFNFLYGLHLGELYRTENLRALVARDMMETGDWAVPRLFGQPLFTKPPGMYVAIALCSWPFGDVTPVSARLPSAMAAAACVFLFAWFFGRRLGPTAGLAAGLILPMSIVWLEKATSGEIDMLYMAFVTASILFFFTAVEKEDGRAHFGWWMAALLCVAAANLTKWTGFVFFYGTAIPYLLARRRWRELFGWPHLLAAAIGAALCLAWVAVAVQREGWPIFIGTIRQESIPRFAPTHFDGAFPWRRALVHPFRIWAACLLWSIPALLALCPGFGKRFDEPGRRLLLGLHCWIWPQMVLWSLVNEHSVRHAFPVFPAIAGLAAMVWLGWHEGKLWWPSQRFLPAHFLVGSVALWIGVKIVYAEAYVPHRNALRGYRERAERISQAVPAGETLQVVRVKDEGMAFHFRRPVRRCPSLADLPACGAYCFVTASDWNALSSMRSGHVLLAIPDELGEPSVLVRLDPPTSPSGRPADVAAVLPSTIPEAGTRHAAVRLHAQP